MRQGLLSACGKVRMLRAWCGDRICQIFTQRLTVKQLALQKSLVLPVTFEMIQDFPPLSPSSVNVA